VSRRIVYALLLGCFFGLAVIKFGNPVVLEAQLDAPQSLSELWSWPWPLRWARAAFLPLMVAGLLLSRPATVFSRQARPFAAGSRLLLVLPLLWLGWQYLSAQHSVDATLTALVLPHFVALVAAYLLGFLLFRDDSLARWLWPGLLAGVAFCLVQAVNQYVVEFPQDLAMYRENERTGWTNVAPAQLTELKHLNLVVTTNGVDIANPIILKKLEKGRVYGTLVYPNALAGLLLLFFPSLLVLGALHTGALRPALRKMVLGLTVALAVSCFFWTGSKAGWLVALGVAGIALGLRPGLARTKWISVAAVLVVGLGVFFVRHAGYFRQGATSASARADYWRAAWVTAQAHPIFGTGPGTFQRPYGAMKSPDQEMARLTHNDYLEQASDAGWPAAGLYSAWIGGWIWIVGRRLRAQDRRPLLNYALWLGLLGWFLQATAEFSLYIPALAWPAFLFAGSLLGATELEGSRSSETAAGNGGQIPA
jgi:O-antigen ligase